jgi:molybdopterin-synthase adenylyltransferase
LSDERRFDRNERLFGRVGQERIAAASLAIVGLGGLGSHVVQQAAYLGCQKLALIDRDVVTRSSLNRLIGAVPGDAEAQRRKVEVAGRQVRAINPDAEVAEIPEWLDEAGARAAIEAADVVIGCLDNDLSRLALTAVTSAARRPYFDLASDVGEDAKVYGGRILFAEPGRRCALCLGQLDGHELALASLSPEHRAVRDTSYGIPAIALGAAGAAVVSINGVVASLAVTEVMVYVTGLRPPAPLLTYRAERGVVLRDSNEPTGPCPYCGRN